MKHALDCTTARELLSARLDGQLVGSGADRDLAAHVAACAACGAHGEALARLAGGFAALRDAPAPPDLWPALEARLDARARSARLRARLARAAAALVGVLGVGAAALVAERGPAPADSGVDVHLLERLAGDHVAPGELFAELPEYRLLRLASIPEEPR